MSFENLIIESKKYFPQLQIKYKNESLLMKIIGKLLFFNKDFMEKYTTTIGNSVYYPNKNYTKNNFYSSTIILLHELVHLKDAEKFNKFIFGFLYLTPQILTLFFIPLLFINWKISLLFLIFSLPIPSFFRMYFERRAYMVSLYCINKIAIQMKFQPLLLSHSLFFSNQFKSKYYYWMWPFKNIEKQFESTIEKIKNNQLPFEDPIFIIIDKLIATL